MQDKKDLTKNVADIAGNLARYALYFLAVVLTPLLAEPVAKLFDWCVLDWSQPGQLRGFFTELFTAIFWILEIAGFLLVEHFFRKSYEQRLAGETGIRPMQPAAEPMAQVAKAAEETEAEAEAAAAKSEGADVKETPETAEKTEQAEQAQEALEGEEEKPEKKKWWNPKPLLPWKNIGALLLITVACILIISIQIDFQVKPFYDLGEKYTYSIMLNAGGTILKNLVKCIWIVMILKAAHKLCEALAEFLQISQVRFLKWIGAGVLLLLFGIYDVCISANPFAWTYLLFYVAFTAIYYFMEKSEIKSFLLVFFIYLF